MELRWTDIHVHLQDELFASDLPAVILRAQQAGVRQMVCNGTSQTDWPAILNLAQQYGDIIPFLGLHPWFIKNCSADWLDQLKSFLTQHSCGLGEIGLDRFIEDCDRRAQEDVFRQQLNLAARLNRPVTIHCVQAWGWLMDILKSERTLPQKMLMHAYSGPAELIEPLTKLGVYFAFSVSVLDPPREKARRALQAVPDDRLLLETGSPDLSAPELYRIKESKLISEGKFRNEPANLPLFAPAIAAIRNFSTQQLAEQTTKNARKFLELVS